MNLRSQEYLAKLLAKENVTVQHGNYSTASFEPEARILRLPLWVDKGKDVYDLLVGHEVGHALYTPAAGWHDVVRNSPVPPAFFNIVEDIRIERKIQETYRGIVKPFKAGYKRLFDDNFFGTNDRTPTSFMDRLNVQSKGRGYFPITFSAEEQPYVDMAMAVQTWDDVVDVCEKIFAFLSETAPKPKQDDDEEEENSVSITDDSTESGETVEDDSTDEGEEESEGESEDESGGEAEDEPESEAETAAEGQGGSEASLESFTDETFRENESSLSMGGNGIAPRFSSGISKARQADMIVSYKELKEEREALAAKYENTYVNMPLLHNYYEKSIKPALESAKSQLAREFERKKAAYEYTRSTVAKTGALNMNRLHQYKYSEDIFLSVNRLAEAKSHGIVMFIDMSGSMTMILEDVIKQAITVGMFCKAVNIPFEAYTFTTSRNARAYNGRDNDGTNEIFASYDPSLVQVLTTDLNTKGFAEACKLLWGASQLHTSHSFRSGRIYSYSMSHSATKFDGMGSTPLVQTVIVAEGIIKKFQNKYGIQKTNVMMLTDGFADNLHTKNDTKIDGGAVTRYVRAISMGGKVITANSSMELYEKALGRLKELTGAKMIGFFLTQTNRDFYSGCSGISDEVTRKAMAVWKKENVSNLNRVKGYDEYFIVKLNNKTDTEFSVDDGAAIKDIKREFLKFNRSKKVSRQLVNKIAAAVAA